MSNLINLHTYWMVNIGVALSYLMAKVFLSIPPFKSKLSQVQQLKFTRKVFIITLLTLLMTPFVLTYLPLKQNNSFQFQPMLKEASQHFLEHHEILSSQVAVLQTTSDGLPIWMMIALAILFGIFVFLIKYIKHFLILKKIMTQSYCSRKINHTHLYFSEKISIPFCWSSYRAHYIFIPTAFLEKNADLKLAIRHELQHIRQGDTYWLHFLAMMKLICFWNPFLNLWRNWFNDLQEFACDETLVLRKKTARLTYAQCLIDAAAINVAQINLPQGVVGLSRNNHSILNRRVGMLFDYKILRKKTVSLFVAYGVSLFTAGSFAYALNNNMPMNPITAQALNSMTNETDLPVAITPEVIAEINNIRGSEQALSYMHTALKRMETYKPYIAKQLKNNGMPSNLLALPFVESGYNPNAKSPAAATGIWQFIPSTAKNFNLTINATRDDRLDTKLSTAAAISYLKALYAELHDWRLAVMAYEIGEDHTERLIKQVGSRDPWILARSTFAPKDLKKFLAMFNASVVIINNPELVRQ